MPDTRHAISIHRPLLDDYRWLVGPEAAGWLEKLAQDGGPLLTAASRLRKDLSAARAHLVLEQVTLRRRAVEKFAQAAQMFFTPLGLEQATGEALARYKAGRFPANGSYADLCCGIGGDLLALVARGTAVGVDRDPVKTLLAEANCRSLDQGTGSFTGSTLLTADVATTDLSHFDAWHLDPDRRAGGKRTTRVEAYEPGPDVIGRCLAVVPHAAIKLAPSADVPDHWTEQVECEWISFGGECRQLVAWFGNLTLRPGRRAATIIETGGNLRPVLDQAYLPPMQIAPVGRYIFEPDAAILAAGLVPELCTELVLCAIAPHIAYLTADGPLHDPAVRCFEVTDVLPFDVKRVRALLRARGIGRLEVKKRGVPHDPEQLRRQLRVTGDQSGTLLLARVGGGVTAIIARRVTPPDPRSLAASAAADPAKRPDTLPPAAR